MLRYVWRNPEFEGTGASWQDEFMADVGRG